MSRDRLIVSERIERASGVVELSLARPDGARLPDWAPGAHIDLALPSGRIRQYSLCGDRWDAHHYRIAVQREPHGRGGSAEVHDVLLPGSSVGFGGPRNAFRMPPGESFVFIAGGIGITPLLPMIAQAEMLQTPWRLLYLGAQRDRMAYRERFDGDPRAVLHIGEEHGRADLDDWRPDDPAVRVAACGPERLLDAVAAWTVPRGGFPPRLERFTARANVTRTGLPFEAVAARSGVRVRVEHDETLTAALARAGVRVVTSCAQGVCGTCETGVVSGEPDHRDSLLTDAERATGHCLFPCVSRSLSAELVLDL